MPDRLRAHEIGADQINERSTSTSSPWPTRSGGASSTASIRLTAVIERLTIPVVVLGVGLQAPCRTRPARSARSTTRSSRFVRAVLDRSPSIGVRGEYTADYLRRLGFRDVEVIGCPSMFVHGDRMDGHQADAGPRPRRAGRHQHHRADRARWAPVITSHVERYPNLEYVAQDIDSLRLLLWGDEPEGATPTSPMPIHRSHPLIRDDKTRFFVDPWPWLDESARMDFMFGTRIHGNIVALLAGTPGYVIAHDTRTLELARYFDIPHRTTAEVTPDIDAAELYAEADFGPSWPATPRASRPSPTISSARACTTSSSRARIRPPSTGGSPRSTSRRGVGTRTGWTRASGSGTRSGSRGAG